MKSVSYLTESTDYICSLLGGQSFCPYKFGEVIRYCENIPIPRAGGRRYWPHKIHPYVIPRRFDWYWVELRVDDVKLLVHQLTFMTMCHLIK